MSYSGTILVHAFSGREFFPIEGANVTVTSRNDGEVEVIAARLTDRSGLAGPFEIPTADPEASEAPESGTPFTTVDIQVYEPNYEKFVMEGVQVFPNVRTVQQVFMLPLSLLPEKYDMVVDLKTPPQNL